MLAQLSSTDWQIIFALSFVAAVIFAYVSDSVLGASSFGVALNGILILVGAFGGLFALDAAIARHYLYVGRIGTPHWVGAWLAGATLLLIVGSLLRGFVNRNASNPWVTVLSFLTPVVITVGLTARAALSVFK